MENGLPTLVIGVGGTGLKVLQRVKERLLETYYGKVPSQITLLEFDTALQSPADNFCGVQLSQTGTQLGHSGSAVQQEIQLVTTNSSFTMDTVFREARDDSSPASRRWSWMEVDKLDQRLPPAARVILDGAGAFRPVGRTAFFLNYGGIEQSLRNAMRQVVNNRDTVIPESVLQSSQFAGVQGLDKGKSKKNVFLIGSLAGGTGSGGFLDLAAMMRNIKETDQTFTDIVLIGIIVMPRFFAEINDALGRRVPNTYAGLRELDRFMRSHNSSTPYKITGGDGRQVSVDNTLFDLCFLVDVEDYNGQLPGSRPDFGALPAIVDMIVAHTDLRLGLRLNAANVNVTSNYVNPPGLNNSGNYEYQASRYYSSLNCHTVIFPREDVAKSLSLNFLLDLLDEDLIARDPRTNQLLVPNEPIRIDDLTAFLGKDNPTPQEKIAAELSAAEGDIDMGIFVRTLIQNGLNPDRRYTTELAEVLRWLVEDSVKRGNVQKVLDNTIKQTTAPLQDPNNMQSYINRVRGWLDRNLGLLVDENNPLGDRSGGDWEQAFGNLVTEERSQMEARVQALVLRLLNQRCDEGQGETKTSMIRANRIGYILGLLRSLKECVRSFMRQTERSFGETSANLIQLRKNLEEKRAEVANFRGGFWKRNPGPDYLKLLQEVAEAERQRLLRNLTMQMAQQFGGDIAQEGRAQSVIDVAIQELEGWQKTLMRVRELLAQERGRHEARRKEKYAIGVRSYITDPDSFPQAAAIEEELYRRYKPVVRRTLLGPDPNGASGAGLYWEPRSGSNSYFDYSLMTKEKSFQLDPNSPNKVSAPMLGVGRGADGIAFSWQEGAFRLLAEQVRNDKEARIAAYIPRLYNQQSNFINKIMDPHSRALVRLDGIQPVPRQEEHYFAVDYTSDDPNVTGFYNWFNTNWSQMNQVYLQSESDVACTYLTLYHGIELDQIKGATECEPQYRAMERTQGCLHLFPEERLAADYEMQVVQRSKPEWGGVSRLHPDVVVGLGDALRVREFALGVVSGMIRDEATARDREHFLFLPDQDPVQISNTNKIINYSIMRDRDRVAARLLQAFQTYMLIGHEVDNPYKRISYDKVMPALEAWFKDVYGTPSGAEVDKLLREWETKPDGPGLYELFNNESRDPRFRDLGVVLLLELFAWRRRFR